MKLVTLSLLTLALASIPAAAQEDAPNPLLKRISIDFKGGQFGNLIDDVEKKLGSRSNVVTDAEALRVKIPPIHLRSVTVPELLKAVGYLSWHLKMMQASDRVIVVRFVSPRQKKEPTPPQVQAFNIGRYLGTYKVEDIVTAVRTAWKMSNTRSQADIKYHAETKLLIIAGSPQDLTAAYLVIGQLNKNSRKKNEK